MSRLQMLIGLCTTQDLICIGHSYLATNETLTFLNETYNIITNKICLNKQSIFRLYSSFIFVHYTIINCSLR